MIIAAVDTTSRSGGVALMKDDALVGELLFNTGETHSRHLPGILDALFNMTGVKVGDLTCIAVSKGPGSFTGLRIGISAVKGIATAVNIPVCPVSSLKTLAHQAAVASTLICPMLDARRKEVYTALYRFKDGCMSEFLGEDALSPENFLSTLSPFNNETILFVGDGALLYKEKIQSVLPETSVFLPHDQNLIRPAVIARLGAAVYRDGKAVSPEHVAPRYIRPSDAKKPL